MDGLILNIDNKQVINFSKLYQILIKDIQQKRVYNSVTHELLNRAVDKYIKDSYLDWKEKCLYYVNGCDYCHKHNYGLEFIKFTDEKELTLCFKCRSGLDNAARKIIRTSGKIAYDKFIQRYLYLNNILQVNDVTKYTSLILFNLYV